MSLQLQSNKCCAEGRRMQGLGRRADREQRKALSWNSGQRYTARTGYGRLNFEIVTDGTVTVRSPIRESGLPTDRRRYWLA
jgi:hypothetical protein